MAKFKVGDVLRAKKINPFSITDEHATVKVLSVKDSGRLYVEVISHERYEQNIGEHFSVDSVYFDAVKKPQLVNK